MTDGTGPGGPEGSALLVAAFRGWNDAADSASDAVAHLAEAWGAEVVHEVDPEPYYDFQVNRPEAVVGEDGARELVWPGTRVLRAEVGGRASCSSTGPSRPCGGAASAPSCCRSPGTPGCSGSSPSPPC